MTDIKSISKIVTPIAQKMVQTEWHYLAPGQKTQQQKRVIMILLYQKVISNHCFS